MSATAVSAPRAVAPRVTGAAAARPLASRVLATAASYVVIYGVTFAFFAPPATQLARSGQTTAAASTAVFVLLLVAALVVTFAAGAFSYSVGWKVESDMRNGRSTGAHADYEFAVFGVLLAVATAAIYLAIMATEGGLTPSLVGAAALALVVPGVVAALFTRSVVDHVAAAKRELAGTTLGAIVVIALTNYLIVGNLPSLSEIPQLFGLA